MTSVGSIVGSPVDLTSSRARMTAAREKREARLRRIPLLPALIFVLVMTQIPFVVTIVISFMKWNALYPDDIGFAGLKNYAATLTSAPLRSAILVSVVVTVAVVIVSALIGLGVAILLDRRFRGRAVVRTFFIAPFLLVPVATSMLWKNLLVNPDSGLFNGILTWVFGWFGTKAPQPDLVSSAPLAVIVAALVWQWAPFMMLIMLAGLQGRALDQIEAARIDGASAWKIFRFVTLPHLRPYLELAVLLGSLYVVQNYDAVSTITAGALGTTNMPYLVYQGFFLGNDYGQAAATGIIISFASLILAVFIIRVASTLLSEEK